MLGSMSAFLKEITMKYAQKDSATSYENFFACCPWCGFRNVFNRVTDLGTTEPIVYKEVHCLSEECKQLFAIHYDSANAMHEMLIFDCYKLLQDKHYAYCILNISQSVEAFVSNFLRVKLIYKPFWSEDKHDNDHANSVAELLYKQTKEYTFSKLRNILINWVLRPPLINTLQEAETEIHILCRLIYMPKDEVIMTFGGDPRITPLLMALKRSKIGELRNLVVHKQRYRPTRKEVDEALEEISSILFPLSMLLGVMTDDVNYYRHGT